MATEAFLLQPNGWIPNNLRYPVIVYRRALVSGEAEQTAQALEYLFKENDWPSADFLVIGAYPQGQAFDVCRQAPNAEAGCRIEDLGPPAYDPVFGRDGPLRRLWSQ